MADEEKFDAVVVGAGPAGTAAAITMAKAGLQVALLERGSKAGSKNVMGGILYNHYLEEIVGDDWKQAPLERPIIEERRWLMDRPITWDAVLARWKRRGPGNAAFVEMLQRGRKQMRRLAGLH